MVRVTEDKITVNVRRKSRGNRFWFELASVRVIGSQLSSDFYLFKTLLKCFVPKYILLAFLSVLKFSKGFIYTRKYEKNKILLKYQYPLN